MQAALHGANETNWTGLTMSVDWGRPEVAGEASTDAIDPRRTFISVDRTGRREYGFALESAPRTTRLKEGDPWHHQEYSARVMVTSQF
jgi:hypothetical protein